MPPCVMPWPRTERDRETKFCGDGMFVFLDVLIVFAVLHGFCWFAFCCSFSICLLLYKYIYIRIVFASLIYFRSR